MAATIGTIRPAVASDVSYLGDRLVVLPITGVNDGDTLATGIPSGITRVAWEPDATNDQVAVTATVSVVTFSTSGAATNHSGNLLVWCKS